MRVGPRSEHNRGFAQLQNKTTFIGYGGADYSGRFLSHILSKLGMRSRTPAALYAARMGLVAGASRQEQPIAHTELPQPAGVLRRHGSGQSWERTDMQPPFDTGTEPGSSWTGSQLAGGRLTIVTQLPDGAFVEHTLQ